MPTDDPFAADSEFHAYLGGYSDLPYGTLLSDQPGRYTYRDVRVGYPGPDPGPGHLEWPLRLSSRTGISSGFATVAQDSIEEVSQSCEILLNTIQGERLRDAPHYGIPEPITGNPQNVRKIQDQTARFEPRAALDIQTPGVNALGEQYVRINVAIDPNGVDTAPDMDRRPSNLPIAP